MLFSSSCSLDVDGNKPYKPAVEENWFAGSLAEPVVIVTGGGNAVSEDFTLQVWLTDKGRLVSAPERMETLVAFVEFDVASSDTTAGALQASTLETVELQRLVAKHGIADEAVAVNAAETLPVAMTEADRVLSTSTVESTPLVLPVSAYAFVGASEVLASAEMGNFLTKI